jgi:hypothetical protein
MTHRAGLPGEAAAGDRDQQVILGEPVGDDQRLVEDHAQNRAREIDVERAAIDGDHALAGLDPDAGDGVLALAGRIGAALLVELLHVMGRIGGRGDIGAFQIRERGESFGHICQALRLFLALSLAMSKTTGVCAACG